MADHNNQLLEITESKENNNDTPDFGEIAYDEIPKIQPSAAVLAATEKLLPNLELIGVEPVEQNMAHPMEIMQDRVEMKALGAAVDAASLGKLDATTIDRVARHFGDRADIAAKINAQLEEQGSKFKVTTLVDEGGDQVQYNLVNRNNGDTIAKASISRETKEGPNEIDAKQQVRDAIELKDLGATVDAASLGKLDARTIDRLARHFGDRADIVAKINAQLEAQGSKFKVTDEIDNVGGDTTQYRLVNRNNGDTIAKQAIARQNHAPKEFGIKQQLS